MLMGVEGGRGLLAIGGRVLMNGILLPPLPCIGLLERGGELAFICTPIGEFLEDLNLEEYSPDKGRMRSLLEDSISLELFAWYE